MTTMATNRDKNHAALAFTSETKKYYEEEGKELTWGTVRRAFREGIEWAYEHPESDLSAEDLCKCLLEKIQQS